MKKNILRFIFSGWIVFCPILVAIILGMCIVLFDIQGGWPFFLYYILVAILILFGLIIGSFFILAIISVVIEKVKEFFNPPLPESNSSHIFPIDKKRQRELEVAHYRMEHFWKPLWKLFLIICVIYTILHVLHVGPYPDGYLSDPYELTR